MSYRIAENRKGTGIEVVTVGELKTMLENIPDDYAVSVMGTQAAVAISDSARIVLMDEPGFIGSIAVEQEES